MRVWGVNLSEHSILSPSSAARRVACPGSRELEARFPESPESDYAREGEVAHWVLRTLLESHISGFTDTELPPVINGLDVTPEMRSGS